MRGAGGRLYTGTLLYVYVITRGTSFRRSAWSFSRTFVFPLAAPAAESDHEFVVRSYGDQVRKMRPQLSASAGTELNFQAYFELYVSHAV